GRRQRTCHGGLWIRIKMKSSTLTSWPFSPQAALTVIFVLGSPASAASDKEPSSTDSPPAPLSSAPASSPSSHPPASSAAATGSAPSSEAPASSFEAPAVPLDGLIGRLAREARYLPKVQPTAEEVLATLEKAGESVPTRQQSLGDTYKASYCLGGYTLDGAFALSACEYADAAAATAGRDLSKTILSHVTVRDVWSHKAGTLAIVQLKDDDATTALKKKLVAAFLAT